MAKTLRDQLYHTLKTSIDHGYLESGLVLLEGSLANLFNMSRSPVRQTLGRLHDEGMICRFDGRGYQVGAFPTEAVRRSLSEEDFRHLGVSKVERTEPWRQVAERVEHDAALCSMKGRFELNELQLSRHFSVSRTITHQILLHLQSIGVAEKVKYASWSLVPLDNERLHNLYEARRQLEPFMIARACLNMSQKEITHYIDRLDHMAKRYPDIEGHLLDELENDLHHKAISMGGNPEIMSMLRRTHPVLLISKHLLGSSVEMPTQDPFFEEHRWVFEKVRGRQADQASRALMEHLTRSQSKVQERLSQFREEGHIEVPDYLRWLEG